MERRIFHFCGSGSRKFWTIVRDGRILIVRYGRMDTTGQMQRKEFSDEDAAAAACAQLIESKVKKGYVEDARPSDKASGATTPTQIVLPL